MLLRVLALMLLTGLLTGLAEAAQLVVQVDNRRPEIGEVFGLHLTFVDARLEAPPSLEIEGLSLALQGSRQSTSRVGGRTVRTFTWTFAATPLAAGSLDIPALELQVDGDTLRSQPLRVEVQPKVSIDGDSAIEGGLNVEEAWVGQVLVYHLEFRTRLRVLDLRWTPPPLEGLIAEQNTQVQSGERRAAIDGQAWTIAEVDMPLVAVAAGARQINPTVLTVDVPARSGSSRPGPMGMRSFSNTKREVFTTDPKSLVVRELPEEGREESWSGLVGGFELDVRLSDDEIALGESATLELRLRGDGTLSGFKLPAAPEGAGYSVYDDDPEVSSAVEAGRFRSQGVWRRAIVPEQEGPLEIAPIELQVFDPNKAEYVTLRSAPVRLEVVAGERSDGVSSFTDRDLDGRQDVEQLADDILPIHPRVSARAQSFSPLAAVGVGGAPWLLLLGLWLRDALAARRPALDPKRELLRRLEAAEQAPLGELEDLLREALALRLSRPAAGIERGDLEDGLSGDTQRQALSLYDGLSAARYGGGVGEGLRERVLAFCRRLVEEST